MFGCRSSYPHCQSLLQTSTRLVKLDGSIRMSYTIPIVDLKALIKSRSYFITQCATTLLWGQILSVFSQKTPLLLGVFLDQQIPVLY